MASIHEKLQLKRVPIDKWSTREQLCLASAAVRSGDQNWSSVSRSLKPFAEPNRPLDWFSQKNCAAQYGSMLENVEAPKRKKRVSPMGQLDSVETPGESILRKLVQERKIELKKKIEEERLEYFKLKEEINTIKQGTASESVIASMCLEIEQEKKQKEQEALAHSEWLKSREERKLEMERVFRIAAQNPQPIIGQKRKASESIESIIGIEAPPDDTVIESTRPSLSPLLTSLLKTPSSLPNVSSSILHSAITNQCQRVTSPTIASLLNSSASVPVSPSLQQLVSTAISQEPTPLPQIVTVKSAPKPQEIIEDTTLPIDSIHKVEKEVKEEVKEEEVKIEVEKEEEKSEEIQEVVEEKKEEIEEEPVEEKEEEKNEEVVDEIKKEEEVEVKEEPEESSPIDDPAPEHDVYDFDESSNKTDNDESAKETTTEASLDSEPETKEETSEESKKEEPIDVKTEVTKFLEKKKEVQPGSVEIVEVVVMEDDDSDKEMNKKVSEIKCDLVRDKSKEKEMIHSIDEAIFSQKEDDEKDKDTDSEETKDKPEKLNIDIDVPECSNKSAFTPEYTEAFFDMAIEVTKLDKSGKAKRDYSRTKKKEEKDIDILLAVEKAVNASMEENDNTEETGSEIDSQDSDKKSDTSIKKVKDNQERSNSPWTEEEEVSFIKSKRRYSTPATPIDSVPNSPASSTAYDDDRDYKSWKKSVMMVYSRLAAHKYASLFLKPITDDTAPGYHTIVFRPMDLQTIRKNIENGGIRTTAEFQRDVLLMFNNALMYNKSNDHVYNMARKMQLEGLQEIQILFQAQAPIETPLRRETRTSESGFKRKRVQDDFIRSKKRRDE